MIDPAHIVLVGYHKFHRDRVYCRLGLSTLRDTRGNRKIVLIRVPRRDMPPLDAIDESKLTKTAAGVYSGQYVVTRRLKEMVKLGSIALQPERIREAVAARIFLEDT